MRKIIAVTGGSCSGKTTLAEFAASHHPELFWVAREAAKILIEEQKIDQTLLTPGGRRKLQMEIFALQRKIEDSAPADKIVLADRATIDSAAYWPSGPEDFWLAVGATHDQELFRYHTAIWLESAAAIGAYTRNTIRLENGGDSLTVGNTIRSLWGEHPNLKIIPATEDFADKTSAFLGILLNIAAR